MASKPNWLRVLWLIASTHKAIVLAGGITLLALVLNPIGTLMVTLAKVAPYVIVGMAIAESAWLTGAAIMIVAIGKQLSQNPLKWRQSIKDMPKNAGKSSLFKVGLAINTAGALAEFVIPTIAVTASLSWQYWAILSFSTIDLWATIVLRRAIWLGIHQQARQA